MLHRCSGHQIKGGFEFSLTARQAAGLGVVKIGREGEGRFCFQQRPISTSRFVLPPHISARVHIANVFSRDVIVRVVRETFRFSKCRDSLATQPRRVFLDPGTGGQRGLCQTFLKGKSDTTSSLLKQALLQAKTSPDAPSGACAYQMQSLLSFSPFPDICSFILHRL